MSEKKTKDEREPTPAPVPAPEVSTAPVPETPAPAPEPEIPTTPAPKNTKKPQSVDPMEELVDFTAPFDPTGERQDIILSVNGETKRVKRGETVQIKRKFLEVWNNAQQQTAEARKAMAAAVKAGQTPLADI